MTLSTDFRLTALTQGGGCSCKLGARQLEDLLSSAFAGRGPEPPRPALPDVRLLCGLESGDDATVVSLGGGPALVTTTDFFPPVVDNAFDWGRIAAANALSDIYAMGGDPVVALNLLAWPTGAAPMELAEQVLRGGRRVTDEAGCLLAGGHSIEDPVPKYGLAVTGVVDPARVLRNDVARAGEPITLTKPLGVGVLNNLHKATGAAIDHAVAAMVALNRDAAKAALAAGVRAATDVTGFGLLGHLFKMARASGVTAVVNAASVPYLDGARQAAAAGYVPGGSRRNLEWVKPFLETDLDELELLLLADAQTSGGLLLAGEVRGAPVIGHFVEKRGPALVVQS
ncbi:MAG: selenide, water dikinase SelD [Acidimicrobiales bacterium]